MHVKYELCVCLTSQAEVTQKAWRRNMVKIIRICYAGEETWSIILTVLETQYRSS